MTSWSYSAYSTAVQCLQKYKLCYIDKVITDAPESGDMAFGSALHSALNAAITGGDAQTAFEAYWKSYEGKDLRYSRFKWTELSKIGSEFIRKFIKSHASYYKVHTAEKRLFAEYKGVKLEGTPDFIGEYDGRTSLRDFKTSGYAYDRAKTDCALQLYLYAYLAHCNSIRGLETLGYTVFCKGTQSIQDLTWDFREEDMYKALDSLVEYCRMLDTTQTFPKNYNACLYPYKCDYFAKCFPKEDVNND